MPASIRYLSAIDVTACMPAVGERLRLAGRAMTALVNDAELPPKLGVHPRPSGSFAHAMPASIRPPGGESPGGDDLLGMKWVTGFAGDPAHCLHYVLVPRGSLAKYYEGSGGDLHMRKPAPEKLFGTFVYDGQIRVGTNNPEI